MGEKRPKPGKLVYLIKDKLLGADCHKGWLETINWVLSWVSNIKTGYDSDGIQKDVGLKIDKADSGEPQLKLLLVKNKDGDPLDTADDGESLVCGGDGEGTITFKIDQSSGIVLSGTDEDGKPTSCEAGGEATFDLKEPITMKIRYI